jgi:hypothetical protein
MLVLSSPFDVGSPFPRVSPAPLLFSKIIVAEGAGIKRKASNLPLTRDGAEASGGDSPQLLRSGSFASSKVGMVPICAIGIASFPFFFSFF